MKKSNAAKWIAVFAVVLACFHTVEVEQAHARIFGGFFARRAGFNRGPVFRQPQFRQQQFQQVFNRQPNFINVGNRRVFRNNFNEFVDLRNTKQLTGFARIRQAGKAIVELDRTGRVNSLAIDRFGRLIGDRDPDTVGQLKEFYFKNLDKFNGNARNIVLRFLGANGGGNTGLFGVLVAGVRDNGVSQGVVPSGPGYKGFTPEKIRTAALAWMLNSMSNSCNPIAVDPSNTRNDGTVGLNLNGFIDRTRLGLVTNDNPYACGASNAVVRVDWMASRFTIPETYYAAMGLDNNLNGLGRQLGIQVDQFNTRDLTGRRIDRTLVKGSRAAPETIVGVNPERVLEVQDRSNSLGTSFYRSYDFIENPTSGVESESRTPTRVGINFTADASEMIFTKCNGYMGFYLANAEGQRARSAPAEIAIDGNKSVTAPDACMKCHANGFMGGGFRNLGLPDGQGNPPKEYSEHFQEIAALGSFHSQFFSPKGNYNQRRIIDSAKFMAGKVRTGAHLADPNQPNFSLPVLFDMAAEYRKPLTTVQAAKELGTQASADLVRALQGNPDGTIDRQNFERNFCRIRGQLGLGGQSAIASNFQGVIGGQNQVAGIGGVQHNGGQQAVQRRVFTR